MTYIIVDFEATCCNRGSIPREKMEIIEIGAVALDGNGPTVLSEFQRFIKPIRNPILTDFCRELTSISQSDVDTAESFRNVMAEFAEWLARFDTPIFCSWGNYDRNQLRQDCHLHGVSYPFSDEHINIKQRFADNMELKRKVGLGRAVRLVDIEFDGTAHRGIDDARNMARLAPYIFTEATTGRERRIG